MGSRSKSGRVAWRNNVNSESGKKTSMTEEEDEEWKEAGKKKLKTSFVKKRRVAEKKAAPEFKHTAFVEIIFPSP